MRTPWDMLMERRTKEQLDEALKEALERARAAR